MSLNGSPSQKVSRNYLERNEKKGSASLAVVWCRLVTGDKTLLLISGSQVRVLVRPPLIRLRFSPFRTRPSQSGLMFGLRVVDPRLMGEPQFSTLCGTARSRKSCRSADRDLHALSACALRCAHRARQLALTEAIASAA
jgi:hypothetical protein